MQRLFSTRIEFEFIDFFVRNPYSELWTEYFPLCHKSTEINEDPYFTVRTRGWGGFIIYADGGYYDF